jgi:hypothetical protein
VKYPERFPSCGGTADPLGTADYQNARRTEWPASLGAFDVTSSGVKVNRAGTYEIDGQCPFFCGAGEVGWSLSNRTELCVFRYPSGVTEVLAAAYFPFMLNRGGGSAPSANTACGGAIKSVAQLEAGDIVYMRGFGLNCSYTRALHSGNTHSVSADDQKRRANASFLTIKMLVSKAFAEGKLGGMDAPGGGGNNSG